MLIYWIEDKKRKGPTTVAEIISFIQLGKITPDTLGWHEGCARWMPLKQLPMMKGFLCKGSAIEEVSLPDMGTAPSSPVAAGSIFTDASQPADQDAPSAPKGDPKPLSQAEWEIISTLTAPSPWARFMARIVDCSLYLTAFYAFLYLIGAPFALEYLPSNPLIWVPMFFLEAGFLTTFRSTPGKALFGIRLCSQLEAQEPLHFFTMLRRAFLVFVMGMGMMILAYPLPIMLFALAYSYWRIKKQRLSYWDERVKIRPVQVKRPQITQYLLAVVLLLCCSTLNSNLTLRWMPEMIELIEEQAPDYAEHLRSMLPPEMQAPDKAPAPPPAPRS